MEWERAYELEKLHLQVESQKLEQTSGLELLPADQQATFNLKKLLPDFDPQDGDVTLFLNPFERQMKILKIGKQNWVADLLGLLPNSVAHLIAREPEQKHITLIILDPCYFNGLN
ncbi:hypothetical protein HNY73_022928 [Argiope bruennichi]|uniref:Uncharacterized protein n=1 Tax=Argiope bruennichi TaxID=94029 RepID=A0A8T0E3I1_ARGBR|nr:hypothetical protein HNY73_022928 [Argiope bruennichi]